jgi:ASC-1-like (ASCH) protein
MRKFILRFRVTDKANFIEIKNGLKVIETRAATLKYREIKVGDMLVIVCGKQRLERKVKRVLTFTSIGSMVKRIPYKKIMPSVNSLAELRQIYYGYPGYKEKLKKHGVIAFDI